MQVTGKSPQKTIDHDIRLVSVRIKRDFEYRSTLNIHFSNDKISVIYGENGCGKTTVLRLLNAFLDQNDMEFSKEKVLQMTVAYNVDRKNNRVSVKKREKKEQITDESGRIIEQISYYYDWTEVYNSPLAMYRSILFGVNRGNVEHMNLSSSDIYDGIVRSNYRNRFENINDLNMFCELLSHYLSRKQRFYKNKRKIKNRLDLDKDTLNIESVSMDVIEELLVEQYMKARAKSNEKVRKALFDTLADACDSAEEIRITDEEYHDLLFKNRNKLITALKTDPMNTLSLRIVKILENLKNSESIMEKNESPLLKRLIVNMSGELNSESEDLQAVNRLESIFNDYIGSEKYLSISEQGVFIRFLQSDEFHTIDALSSGERHLLVLLAIFVLEGKNRHLFMIDEPEISLNMNWQRKLLKLLHELAPNAEIIVASHSPSIARENPKWLVELR